MKKTIDELLNDPIVNAAWLAYVTIPAPQDAYSLMLAADGKLKPAPVVQNFQPHLEPKKVVRQPEPAPEPIAACETSFSE
jgi:hypothetical protein